MRTLFAKILFAALLVLPVACVTINVYFPEAAADKAAEQFVDKVLGEPAKDAPAPTQPQPQPTPPPGKSPGAMLLDFVIPSAFAQAANLTIQTPQIQQIQARMQARFGASLSGYFASGAIGFGKDGLVAVRDATGVALADRAPMNAAVADENRDRQAVYREIAIANGHPEWESQIRASFAKQWIQQAKSGWYYQDTGGAWKQK